MLVFISLGMLATAHNIYQYLWKRKMDKLLIIIFYVVLSLLLIMQLIQWSVLTA